MRFAPVLSYEIAKKDGNYDIFSSTMRFNYHSIMNFFPQYVEKLALQGDSAFTIILILVDIKHIKCYLAYVKKPLTLTDTK